MDVRATGAAATCLVALLGGPASAAPVACNLLTDRPDDAKYRDPRLEIRTVDVASNARRLTGVIRFAGDPDDLSPASTGRQFHIVVKAHGAKHPALLSFLVTPDTRRATYGWFDPKTQYTWDVGPAEVAVVGNELRLTVGLPALAPYGRFTPGTRVTYLEARALYWVGVSAGGAPLTWTTTSSDGVKGPVAYVAGARSCVRVR